MPTSASTSSMSSSNAGSGGSVSASTANSTGSTGGAPACADTTVPQDCGACGHDCTKLPNVVSAAVTCSAGVCAYPNGACASDYAHCSANADDGCETKVLDDPANCGACKQACLVGQLCGANKCTENQVTCATAGTCPQAFCNDPGHYSVTPGITVDIVKNRRLWQRTGSPMTMDNPTAVNYCGSLNIEGITGWRLPTQSELGSIVFKAGLLQGCPAKYCSPAVDQASFLGTVSDLYWTSTPYMDFAFYCVNFCDGRTTPWKEDATALHYVRCVHDPLP